MRSRRSGIRWKIVAAAVGLVALAGSPAAGQQDLTASIIGQVTDQSGAVLPGVTVTATSPALQVPQVTSTRSPGQTINDQRIITNKVSYQASIGSVLKERRVRRSGG